MSSNNMNLVGGNGNQQTSVTPDDLTFEQCGGNGCDSEIFQSGFKIGTLSPVHPKNNTGTAKQVQVPVAYCIECGRMVDEKDFG